MNIKLTVVIPVYNQEELVIRALDSIPKRDDIEIIVIDDASTDNTWNNLLEYRDKNIINQDIILLYNNENKGVGLTVNKGYDYAIGEYVVLLGSDDYFITDKVNYFVDELLDGTDLIYFNLEENNGNVWRINEDNKKGYCGSVKFMRREFIGDTRCPDKRASEDADFYKELLNKNPTEKFTDIVVKHYNFPREGSLYDLFRKGEIK